MARFLAGLLSVVLLLVPVSGASAGDPIRITDDRVYREGVFLLLDALVQNGTGRSIDGVEVTVVFLDFFDALVRVEHTVLRPLSLAPGQVASLRIAVPFHDSVRKLEYRFTWREEGSQLQSRVRRDIWLGSAVR
ncbi:MAG TPA: hypothetical protein VJU81_04430 [Methylomirabilota bacterium]|nr:hypothetical protein [Methylomirabilota bacterium]